MDAKRSVTFHAPSAGMLCDMLPLIRAFSALPKWDCAVTLPDDIVFASPLAGIPAFGMEEWLLSGLFTGLSVFSFPYEGALLELLAARSGAMLYLSLYPDGLPTPEVAKACRLIAGQGEGCIPAPIGMEKRYPMPKHTPESAPIIQALGGEKWVLLSPHKAAGQTPFSPCLSLFSKARELGVGVLCIERSLLILSLEKGARSYLSDILCALDDEPGFCFLDDDSIGPLLPLLSGVCSGEPAICETAEHLGMPALPFGGEGFDAALRGFLQSARQSALETDERAARWLAELGIAL